MQLRDTNGHQVISAGKASKVKNPINIGDHVWVAADCTILPGSQISNGSVIAANSVVCGIRMDQDDCLIAGVPARVKKTDVNWKE